MRARTERALLLDSLVSPAAAMAAVSKSSCRGAITPSAVEEVGGARETSNVLRSGCGGERMMRFACEDEEGGGGWWTEYVCVWAFWGVLDGISGIRGRERRDGCDVLWCCLRACCVLCVGCGVCVLRLD